MTCPAAGHGSRPGPNPPAAPPPLLRDASALPGRTGADRTGFTCACCGREVVTSVPGLWHNPPVGSPRRFCSPACRQAALRRRRAGVAEDTPLQLRGGGTRSLTALPAGPGGKDTP